ncbi:hypothetical protein AB1L07_02150 [Niallia alba]
MNKSEMIKDGFWHIFKENNESVAWREYKWDELRQCFIYRNLSIR